MATTLPVTFRASPLPSTFRGTPQQIMDAMVARLSIEGQDELSFFVTGSVAPSSNVGPWLKNGVTWYVWDDVTGAYIPEILEFKSLRYIVQQAAPSHIDYTLWIETNGSGQAIAIKTYSNGAWRDIYEDRFVKLEAVNPVGVKLTGTQLLDVDTSIHKVLFNQVMFDAGAVYDSANSKYVAAISGIYRITSNLQVDNGTAVAADMELAISALVNDAPGTFGPSSGESTPSPNGARWYPGVNGLVQLLVGDSVSIWLSGNDGVNTGNVQIASSSQFYVELVKAT